MAAGLDPAAFWRLTPRVYGLHMRGAQQRIERDLEVSNRLAYNTAALTGGAMGGKLPNFDKVFGRKLKPGVRQTADQLEANLRALVIAWGGEMPPTSG